MRKICIVLLAAATAGCATSRETYAPDGRVGHTINCSGAARTWGDCIAKAGDICAARGYDVIERSDQQGAILTATPNNMIGGVLMYRSMLIACKK